MNPATQHRSANALVGMAVKGVIFYQGINNAVGDARPRMYAKTFTAPTAK